MDEQEPRIRRRRERRDAGSQIIGSGITTGSNASKQTIFLAPRGDRRGRRPARGDAKGTGEGRATVVEGDRKGGVVLLLALRRILIELLAAFLSLLSRKRAHRFKCFRLCLKIRAHLARSPFLLLLLLLLSQSFSPLSHYTLLTGYASSWAFLPRTPASLPLPQDFYGLDLLARRFVNHAKCTALKGVTTT